MAINALGWLKLLILLMIFSHSPIHQCLDLKCCKKTSPSRSSKSTCFSYFSPETPSLLFFWTTGMDEMFFIFLTTVFKQDGTVFS